MIPILSIFKFLALPFGIWGVIRLRNSCKRNPQNEALCSFYKFFLYFVIVFSFFVIQPLIHLIFKENSLVIIQAIYCAVFFLFFFLFAYLIKVILLFTYLKKIRQYLFWAVVSLSIVLLIWNIISFKPASMVSYQMGNLVFVRWIPTLSPPIVIYFLLGLTSIFLVAACLLFFLKGFSLDNPYLKRRSLFLGVSMLFLLVAAAGFLTLGEILELSFWSDLLHGLGTFCCVLFLLFSIYYKESEIAKIE